MFDRFCRTGTVAPRQIQAVAGTPSLLKFYPNPAIKDVPMIRVPPEVLER